MKTFKIVTVTAALVVSTSTNAALIERLGGLAYYDDVADITWLADENYAWTTGYDQTLYGYDNHGGLTWSDANTWAANLNVAGVTGWRLPDTLQPDPSCSYTSPEISFGTGCTGSELGNLFYNVLGGTAHTSINTNHNSNYDLFGYLEPAGFWSATEAPIQPYPPYYDNAFSFTMSGNLVTEEKSSNHIYAWAVHTGDVSAVPIPTAAWLFGSGLISLIGVARRKKK